MSPVCVVDVVIISRFTGLSTTFLIVPGLAYRLEFSLGYRLDHKLEHRLDSGLDFRLDHRLDYQFCY
jgi:hypothetical protein